MNVGLVRFEIADGRISLVPISVCHETLLESFFSDEVAVLTRDSALGVATRGWIGHAVSH